MMKVCMVDRQIAQALSEPSALQALPNLRRSAWRSSAALRRLACDELSQAL
jgi:DNA-binding transcriptional ArsR family regulator